MPYLDKPFDVPTRSGRRPTPTTYVHLRKYAELIKQYLPITNVTELTEVNQLLNQTVKLYISNEISRVIAQIIGETALGFETIKATLEGALHAYLTGGTIDSLPDVNLADGTKMIGRVQVQGLAHTPLSKFISISGDDTHDIIDAVSDVSHHITSICLTVAGEVDLILRDETGVLSGAMDFGATDEPRGMTQTHELTPLICHENEAFQITLDGAIQVSGYVTYYDA